MCTSLSPPLSLYIYHINTCHIYVWTRLWSAVFLCGRLVVQTHHLCFSHIPAQEMVPLQVPIAEKDAAGRTTGFSMGTVHMLDPHSVVAYLVNVIGLVIPPDDVATYWDRARANGEAWATNHPATSRHMPLGLYGDEARFNTAFSQDKVLGLFINLPLWRPKSIRASRFLIFALEENKLYKHFTLDAVLRRIVWSINLLFDGSMPQVDHIGNPIRGAKRGRICNDASVFALCELRGDLFFHKQLFRWKASWTWTSLKVCHKCEARSRDGGPLYYHWDNWTSTEFGSFQQWLGLRMPNSRISR